jgi:antitoxin component of MazEF toxin-antitoxin module
MVTSNVRKVGNSYMVAIPRGELERLGISAGDTVSVEVRPVVVETRPRLAPRDRAHLDALMRKHDGTLRLLADK